MTNTWSPSGPLRSAFTGIATAVRTRPYGNTNTHRGPWGRGESSVPDPGPHRCVSRARIDARIERHDPCGKRSRVAGDENFNLIALAQTGSDALGDREVHVHGLIHALQRCQLGALVQILAGV